MCAAGKQTRGQASAEELAEQRPGERKSVAGQEHWVTLFARTEPALAAAHDGKVSAHAATYSWNRHNRPRPFNCFGQEICAAACVAVGFQWGLRFLSLMILTLGLVVALLLWQLAWGLRALPGAGHA
jgi:hypothetical protein